MDDNDAFPLLENPSFQLLASVVAASADLRRLCVFVVAMLTTDNLNLG